MTRRRTLLFWMQPMMQMALSSQADSSTRWHTLKDHSVRLYKYKTAPHSDSTRQLHTLTLQDSSTLKTLQDSSTLRLYKTAPHSDSTRQTLKTLQDSYHTRTLQDRSTLRLYNTAPHSDSTRQLHTLTLQDSSTL